MSAVRAHETYRGGNNLPSNESLATDFALVLAVAAVIIIEVVVRGTAKRTDSILGDGFPIAPLNRFDGLTILPEIVLQKELPVLFDEWLDDREAICGKLLIFRGVGIIEGPLLERDISADKVQEPANSFVLFLNYSK